MDLVKARFLLSKLGLLVHITLEKQSPKLALADIVSEFEVFGDLNCRNPVRKYLKWSWKG